MKVNRNDSCVVMYVLMISLSYITLPEDSEPDRFPSFNCVVNTFYIVVLCSSSILPVLVCSIYSRDLLM